MKKALITGINGQDGSYLAELLIEKGYEVHGTIRRHSNSNTLYRLEKVKEAVIIHIADLLEYHSLNSIISSVIPDEIYNLAAQSHVAVSFNEPEITLNITGAGTLRLLNSIKDINNSKMKFYQAGSSDMFGHSNYVSQSESTPFKPRSPYGCAKAYAHNITVNYREQFGIFACNGILFNHESPRRSEDFVTKKICKGIAAIKKGTQQKIKLGNIDIQKDWGYAKDYVYAMWLMLQQEIPDDYIIASGEVHTVRQFLELAFKIANLGDYQKYIEIDQTLFRPAEPSILRGDSTKAKLKLNWTPQTSFEELVTLMVNYELLNSNLS